ncbi:hypothetical protein KHA80_16620 [Anaerobacillus sp. HL2]|nr:hypothetical protein KHA80_16620 [Anaerobacillus sp. HL2]
MSVMRMIGKSVIKLSLEFSALTGSIKRNKNSTTNKLKTIKGVFTLAQQVLMFDVNIIGKMEEIL